MSRKIPSAAFVWWGLQEDGWSMLKTPNYSFQSKVEMKHQEKKNKWNYLILMKWNISTYQFGTTSAFKGLLNFLCKKTHPDLKIYHWKIITSFILHQSEKTQWQRGFIWLQHRAHSNSKHWSPGGLLASLLQSTAPLGATCAAWSSSCQGGDASRGGMGSGQKLAVWFTEIALNQLFCYSTNSWLQRYADKKRPE